MSNSLERTRPTWAGRYITSFVAVLAAIPLTLTAGVPFGLGALAFAILCYAQTRVLLKQIEDAPENQARADEEIRGTQVFSSIDELSAGIAHEINNPLAIIVQEIQWIQHLFRNPPLRDLAQTEECDESLQEISRQVDRCKETVAKLLSLARQMRPVIQEVDINDLILSMADLARPEAATKDIEIVCKLAPHIPTVQSDPPLLRQVLLNLLMNSAQAIEEHGSIILATRATEDGYVEITVQDTGSGIPKEVLPRVFTPFFSTKPEGKGTGLGLAISRGIVERLGGHIFVTSDLGKGATFVVELPVHGLNEGD